MVLGHLASEDEKMKPKILEISKMLHEIEPHIPKLLRYPFRYNQKWIIPTEYYTKEMAQQALEKAKQILKITQECLEKLGIKNS